MESRVVLLLLSPRKVVMRGERGRLIGAESMQSRYALRESLIYCC